MLVNPPSITAVLLLLLPANAAVSLGGLESPWTSSNSSPIEWVHCGLSSTNQLNETFPILCGTVAVPLDYTEAGSGSKVDIPLLKIAARNESLATKSVLVNFGGPGINNTVGFVGLGAQIKSVVGHEYSLITFHPRGTADNLPFDCFLDSTSRDLYASSSTSSLGNASDTALGGIWAQTKVLADRCAEVQAENGSLIGTAYTVRDMMQIVDALNEDGLLRYWGFSYGSVLGATAAAMFPERIDKLIIDGVVNSHEYYHSYALADRSQADATLWGFSMGCVQYPHLCPVARNRTAEQVQSWILDLIDRVKFDPIVIPNPAADGGDLVITYTTLKYFVYSFMYSPSTWPSLASLLGALEDLDPAPILEYVAETVNAPPEVDLEAEQGIRCGDTLAPSGSFPELVNYVHTQWTTRLGGDIEDQISMQCAQWPFHAKERYDGDFRVRGRHPILVIGNTWDPATAIRGARNMSESFTSAVLLEQRGYGHGSVAQPSLCTANIVREYFGQGKLPVKGTICDVDGDLFSDDGGSSAWASVLSRLNHRNASSVAARNDSRWQG